jgi:hypothetical protein
MTVEGPQHALVPGHVADQPERDRWRTAPYRCPCGFAADDAGEFDRHLNASEGADPEHFEVLAGWTRQQVRQWQAMVASSHLGTAVAGPVLTAGSGLFDGEGRPLVVRLEVPLSAGEMVAALYGEHERLTQADLGTDQDVWRYVAVVIAQDGMQAIEQLANIIDEQERCRTLAAPEWLAWCRRRVDEVAARGVPASASRVRQENSRR